MSELVVSIALVLVFASHLFWFRACTQSSWWFAVAYVVALDVTWMSHMWHILYGEDRIGICDARHEAEIFGWTPCFVSEWNTYVNTYEITLVVEFLFLSVLTYFVIRAYATLVEASVTLQILAYVLNTLNLIMVLMLFLASPLFLDGFEDVFTVTGFVCSLLLVAVLEYVSYEQRNGRRLPL